MIPEGQRALSVRVNDVVGVAGYVLPGTRVDVVATMNPTQNQTDMTSRVILTNVQVVAAGTRIEQDEKNKPIQVTVVTLLVNPDEAEKLTLASTEGKIQLALRNPLDKTAPPTSRYPSGAPDGRRARASCGVVESGTSAAAGGSSSPSARAGPHGGNHPRRQARARSRGAGVDDANDRAAEMGRRVRRPDVHHRRLRDAACDAGAGGAGRDGRGGDAGQRFGGWRT